MNAPFRSLDTVEIEAKRVERLAVSERNHQMEKPTRGELLEKYCKREPTPFFQYDGFLGKPNDKSDCIFQFDKNGFCFFDKIETYELMHGADVRVFVKPGTPPEITQRILKEIAACIKRDGLPKTRIKENDNDLPC